ncbi:hypothetical protein PHYBOEH_001785 [Phytophthora boehmeriae]|uniref:lipid-A-disaccharide synthase n=1 Tax=Phytophthora boehmeriae TaxID=109152 RepID=A0A8T1XCD6_9STRA|nr:hypothetical protein PHYBOEH_001785 [Phytophthora boehmeriae]
MGIPTDALVICALVGSRSNEVKKSLQIVLEAIQKFKQTSEAKHDKQICVIFPTIAAVEHQLKGHVSSVAPAIDFHVIADLDAGARLQLFQSADLAVAVSGTIVLETTLASLPTVVVYRANRVTEWVAKRLAAVRFVSVPNLLLGRSLLPELLFSDFTAPKVAEAMQSLQRCALNQADSFHLAMALSTLTNWKETDSTSLSPGVLSGKDGNGSSTSMQPIRASDLVAKRIIEVLDEK